MGAFAFIRWEGAWRVVLGEIVGSWEGGLVNFGFEGAGSMVEVATWLPGMVVGVDNDRVNGRSIVLSYSSW